MGRSRWGWQDMEHRCTWRLQDMGAQRPLLPPQCQQHSGCWGAVQLPPLPTATGPPGGDVTQGICAPVMLSQGESNTLTCPGESRSKGAPRGLSPLGIVPGPRARAKGPVPTPAPPHLRLAKLLEAAQHLLSRTALELGVSFT